MQINRLDYSKVCLYKTIISKNAARGKVEKRWIIASKDTVDSLVSIKHESSEALRNAAGKMHEIPCY